MTSLGLGKEDRQAGEWVWSEPPQPKRWMGRRARRLKLAELAQLGGEMDYTTAGAALSRFSRRVTHEAAFQSDWLPAAKGNCQYSRSDPSDGVYSAIGREVLIVA